MAKSYMEIWEGIEARLRNVEWSKSKPAVRLASYDSVHEPDAWDALSRNAAAAERREAEQPKVRRMSHPPAPPPISEEVRDEYAYIFAEREGLKMDAGMPPRCSSKDASPDCCAYHSTLIEVGCLEFFDHARALPYVPGMVRCALPPPSPLFCERCQSVGHQEATCSFKTTDEAVTTIAQLRRERRASAKERRRKAV